MVSEKLKRQIALERIRGEFASYQMPWNGVGFEIKSLTETEFIMYIHSKEFQKYESSIGPKGEYKVIWRIITYDHIWRFYHIPHHSKRFTDHTGRRVLPSNMK